eukprot:COSAG01_NODE_16191_length_1261_cov_1.241824_1_plen_46_part_10
MESLAPVAGLPTARSPGGTPSPKYIEFLNEGVELVTIPNFLFTDYA